MSISSHFSSNHVHGEFSAQVIGSLISGQSTMQDSSSGGQTQVGVASQVGWSMIALQSGKTLPVVPAVSVPVTVVVDAMVVPPLEALDELPVAFVLDDSVVGLSSGVHADAAMAVTARKAGTRSPLPMSRRTGAA
jgi:hypothetical protein